MPCQTTRPTPGAPRRWAARGRSVAVAVLVVLATACGTAQQTDRTPDEPLEIVATTTILGDIVRNVAPSDAEVSVLMEPGADPHTFEPSARQIAEMGQADLVVANGGGLEEGLATALDEARAAGVPLFFAIDHATPLSAGDVGGDTTSDEHVDEPSESGHGGSTVDPHIWMDPVRMLDVVTALGTHLGQVTGASEDARDRARTYAAELEDLDRQIAGLLVDIPEDRRTLVSNHASLSYFADRYDLRIVGTVIPGVSTGAEPSAQDIDQLVDVMRREEITTVFTDSTAPPELAETLAREVGANVEIVELYAGSLGARGEATTYIDMLATDGERIAEALRR